MSEFDLAFEKIAALCKDFQSKESYFKSAVYSEAQARIDFIDKFWIALGWDVNHEIQTNPYEQEVKVEKGVDMRGTHRRADYAFFLSPNFHDVQFFVEAKKPSVEIGNAESYFQLIRYGWNSETPLAVLTDFEQLHVLDCRYQPDIETALNRSISNYHYLDYKNREKFAEIYWLFSREAVADGSVEKRAKELPKPRGKTIQRGLFPGGYQSIDESFLAKLDDYRTSLARTFKNKNPDFNGDTLTELAQRTLDRLVFLRFLEDKGIEPVRLVEGFGDKGSAWKDFITESRRLDGIYNGIVYKHHDILDAKKLIVDDKVFAQICEDIAHANSPYDFNAIPIHILGSIYERFLGKVIVATAKRAKVEEKPEVRKAGGVYYTPEYVVQYIVENTVGKLIEGKKPAQIAKMRFADISCGSGSFLLGVFDVLLKYHGQYYNKYPGRVKKGECVGRDDKLFLSLNKKREILLKNIYGVDIDSQAVEVCQLSLYLKLLEDETEFSAQQYSLDMLHTERMKQLLPDLSKNIVCGNSLIGRDILEGQLFASDEERKLNPMDFEDEFPEIMKRGGFDAIVGNPPYIPIESMQDVERFYYSRRYPQLERKFDTSVIFILAGLALIRKEGLIGFISSVTWQTGENSKKLRETIFLHAGIIEIINLPFNTFKNAYVDTGIYILSRKPSSSYSIYRFPKKVKQVDLQGLPFIHVSTDLITSPEFRVVLDPVAQRLLSRFKASPKLTSLGEFTRSTQGLAASRFDRCETQKNETWYPFLEQGQVYRYELVVKRMSFADLTPFGSLMPFYEATPKILIRRVINRQDRLCAMYDETSLVFKKDINPFVITDPAWNAKYVLGIMNSSLISYLYVNTSSIATKDDFRQTTLAELRRLPIPKKHLSTSDDRSVYSTIVRKVEAMLGAKKELAKAKTDKDKSFYEKKCSALDRQIDALVYELYDLTDEEIEIVEETVVM